MSYDIRKLLGRLRRRRVRGKGKRYWLTGRRLGIELYEQRCLLSISQLPDLPGLRPVDLTPDDLRGQLVYLDADGEDGVKFRGPVEISEIDVPAFKAPGLLAGQEPEIIGLALDYVRTAFTDSGVAFTLDRPSSGPYSTVFIGGSGSAFSAFGEFPGLAEHIDVRNQDTSDIAFVFADSFYEVDTVSMVSRLGWNIAHEVGHLIGYMHDTDAPADDFNYLAAESGRFVSVSRA